MKAEERLIKICEDWNKVLHPPYIQLDCMIATRPKYQIYNSNGVYVCGSQRLDDLSWHINYFFSK